MNPNKSCCNTPPMHTHHEHSYVSPSLSPHHHHAPNHMNSFPYDRPACDSYSNMCGNNNGRPDKFPVTGPFVGNAFVLKDTMPYLVDSTFMEYGQSLCFSENVYTKITQRKDPSCINLSATFDMTDTMLTNTVRNDFLKKNIAKKYSVLNGLLPIIKNGLKFYIYYTITNFDGGVEHEGVTVTYSPEMRIHFTDIRDVFVSSIRNVVIENIQPMTYQGMYTITIDRVEAYVAIIDTTEHVEGDMNPYYSFINNNMGIKLNHSSISTQRADNEILIAECPVNKSFDYRSNLTTRLRIDFVAFMSHIIASGDTSGVWENLYTPTEEIITTITNDVRQLGDEIKMLKEIIEHQNILIEKLNSDISTNTNNIIRMSTKLSDIEKTNEDLKQLIKETDENVIDNANNIVKINEEMSGIKEFNNDIEKRVIVLESIPRAVRGYHVNTEYITGQLVWNNVGKLYQVAKNFISQSGNNKNDCMLNDINKGNLVSLSVGSSSSVVQKYERGITLQIGQLVYNKSGEIYQVVNEYTISNDIKLNIDEAFEKDVAIGNIKPIGSFDVIDMKEKLNESVSEISKLKEDVSNIDLTKIGGNDSIQTVFTVLE